MCTGIQLIADDGAAIGARTMEFGKNLESNIAIVPTGTSYDDKKTRGNMPWTARYGAVGANAYDTALLIEGINEKGLSAGAFFFPGYASYTPISKVKGGQALAPVDLVSWILTTCATLEDVSKQLPSIPVADFSETSGDSPLPLHFLVRAPHGHSIVIEYTNEGTLDIYDNEIGVFTNSPPFDWHVANLNNYVNLSPRNVKESNALPVSLNQIGQGSGLLGIPGDFTPPSRFVRAAFYAASAFPGTKASDAVNQVFHVLNLFDIPFGTIRSDEEKSKDEITEWTTASDMKNLVFYIKTHGNQQVRYVDVLQALSDAGDKVTYRALDQKEQYINLTSESS